MSKRRKTLGIKPVNSWDIKRCGGGAAVAGPLPGGGVMGSMVLYAHCVWSYGGGHSRTVADAMRWGAVPGRVGGGSAASVAGSWGFPVCPGSRSGDGASFRGMDWGKPLGCSLRPRCRRRSGVVPLLEGGFAIPPSPFLPRPG